MSYLKNPTDPSIPNHVIRGFLLDRDDANLDRDDANFVKPGNIPYMKDYTSAPALIKTQIRANKELDPLIYGYYVDDSGECWQRAYNSDNSLWFPIQKVDPSLCKSVSQGGYKYKMRRKSVRGHKKSNRRKSRSRR